MPHIIKEFSEGVSRTFCSWRLCHKYICKERTEGAASGQGKTPCILRSRNSCWDISEKNFSASCKFPWPGACHIQCFTWERVNLKESEQWCSVKLRKLNSGAQVLPDISYLPAGEWTWLKSNLCEPGWLSSWAPAFTPRHDPGVLGSSPMSGSLHGACFFFLSLSVSLMDK